MSENLPKSTRIPARDIPVPSFLSPEAQAQLASAAFSMDYSFPALDDKKGWRDWASAKDQEMLPLLSALTPTGKADVEECMYDGVRVIKITPENIAPNHRRIILDIHGGGLICGGGEACCLTAKITALRLEHPTCSVDYRMPPDHPYPAGLDDCVRAYRALLREHLPREIFVHGISAGGNLAASMVLRARDEGLPLPAGLILNTPEIDLTESGDSFHTNLGIDPLPSLMPVNLLYANGKDLAHPYLSPLFGDVTKGFPPTILTAGTRDLYLSNTVRFHRALRRAGIPAELHVFEAMSHSGFQGAPEDRELTNEISRFIYEHWKNEEE